ncbi:hypothetical protein [Spirobacillus cienkowskii]|uniref:hypothetical protein n=1 Tax=Spirobacillus cienkowskii TaxID=495820 RepID=UPI0030CA78BF
MKRDQEIYNSIGKILNKNKLKDSDKILFYIKYLNSQRNVCETGVFAKNEDDKESQITLSEDDSTEIHTCADELYEYFKNNNLPDWNGLSFILDLKTDQYDIDFIDE